MGRKSKKEPIQKHEPKKIDKEKKVKFKYKLFATVEFCSLLFNFYIFNRDIKTNFKIINAIGLVTIFYLIVLLVTRISGNERYMIKNVYIPAIFFSSLWMNCFTILINNGSLRVIYFVMAPACVFVLLNACFLMKFGNYLDSEKDKRLLTIFAWLTVYLCTNSAFLLCIFGYEIFYFFIILILTHLFLDEFYIKDMPLGFKMGRYALLAFSLVIFLTRKAITESRFYVLIEEK